MNKREFILLIIICIGAVLLFTKSLIFDEVKNLEGLDETFRIDIENTIDQTYNDSIIKHRLIKITTKENEGKIIYTGKIRKYFLGVFPFSDINIKIEYDLKEVKDES
jgi:hypothetical protein